MTHATSAPSTCDILERLVSFDTTSALSNLALIDFVQDFLTRRGARVTRISDPEMPKAGLYAEIGPPGQGILLSGHSDVVPVTGQPWTRPPFQMTQENGRVYGRGTTDMKGFVAAMLRAADDATRRSLKAPLQLVLSYDEEVGCTGIARMMDRLLPLIGQPRVAIVGEPTQMLVATGHKGKAGFVAHCHGVTGHSALAPRFVNALQVAARFTEELRHLQNDLAATGARDGAYDVPYSTVHVGKISGGMALNIVPDIAEVTFEFRHLAAESPKDLRLRVDQAAEAAAAAIDPRARISITPITAYPGLDIAPDAPAARHVLALAGQSTTKVAFGTEAGFFMENGIPTVVCGPGSMEGQGHKADEFIELEALATCDAFLDRVLDDLSA